MSLREVERPHSARGNRGLASEAAGLGALVTEFSFDTATSPDDSPAEGWAPEGDQIGPKMIRSGRR